MTEKVDSVEVYDDRADRSRHFASGATTGPVTTTTVVAAQDRIHWGSIIAGLFAALSTLAVLSVLGLAIGLSSYDTGDALGNFGLGAGVWGAVSTLIAFLVGGWLAGRSVATISRGNRILNAAMVWAVTIPLVLYLLSSGIGSLLGTAGNIAATGVSAVAPAAGAAVQEASEQPGAQATVQTAGSNLADSAQATASALGNQVTDEQVEQATETASGTAWGTLVGLLLGLAASILGGWLATRDSATTQLATA